MNMTAQMAVMKAQTLGVSIVSTNIYSPNIEDSLILILGQLNVLLQRHISICIFKGCDFEHSTVDKQITSCQSCEIRGPRLTCNMPTVSYGSTSGGVPTLNDRIVYEDWCKEMGFTGDAFVDTKSETYSGQLFWCSGYDDPNYKWCDWADGYWKDAPLNKSGAYKRIKELTCLTGNKVF